MIKLVIFLIFFLTVVGCATTNSSALAGEKSAQDRFSNALISPLNDLNIVQNNIVPVIQDALKSLYQTPDDHSRSVG